MKVVELGEYRVPPRINAGLVACLCLLAFASAANAASPPWNAARQGRFITALCQDGRGDTWVDTEGQGVWEFNPAANRWTQFHGKKSYSEDNCYALTCDRLGRVWCGGLHGLYVFTGDKWRRYTPLNGPPGFRIFCLTTDPVSGDVWGGTEAGLFRYSLSTDKWTSYARLGGLPSDAIQAVAFSAAGRLFVGTQADGIAIGSRLDDFKKWTVVHGPSQMPNAPAGDGLPSPLINCLLGAADGAIYAGTPCGLAVSHTDGVSWHYLRGANWLAKVKGLYHGPKPENAAWRRELLTADRGLRHQSRRGRRRASLGGASDDWLGGARSACWHAAGRRREGRPRLHAPASRRG